MISIVGATGFTGSLIASILDKGCVPVRLVGRDRIKLENLRGRLQSVEEIALADARDADSLKSALSGSNVVINCAGPFSDFGLPVVSASVDLGLHYLDITGEQWFIGQVIERFDQAARRHNCTLVPSCAFEYALGDAAAAFIAAHFERLDFFEANYIISGFHTSRGTKHSIIRAMASDSYQLEAGELQKISPGSISRFDYGGGNQLSRFAFPGGEVHLCRLHTAVDDVHTYLCVNAPSAVLAGLSVLMPILAVSLPARLIDTAINLTEAVPRRHQESIFKIACLGGLSQGRKRSRTMHVNISGRDPYSLTASIISACALALIENRDGIPRGVVSASMVQGYEFIKSLLEKKGVVWSSGLPE